MGSPVDFLMKHKKSYLMIGGTLLPAMGLYLLARSLNASIATQNLLAVGGLIAGGMLTAKMLKS